MKRLSGNELLKVSELRTDGSTEYRTNEMKELLEKEGIELLLCNTYIPQHNGVSEKLNLEIENKIAVNLISAKMPYSF